MPARRVGPLTWTTLVCAVAALLAAATAVVVLVEHLSASHLKACGTLGITGCNGHYTLVLGGVPHIAGEQTTVYATVRHTSGGAPVKGATVTFSYPGEPSVTSTTDSEGHATAAFTQRAGTSTFTAAITEPGPWLSPDVVTAEATTTTTGQAAAYSDALKRILYQPGAYAVQDAQQAQDAIADGFRVLLTDDRSASYRALAAASGAAVIDSQLKAALYSILCSSKTRKCHAPTSADLDQITQRARTAITSPTGQSPATAAWYVLDDYRFVSFKPALLRIHQVLADLGDSRPMICAFSLHLSRVGDSSDARSAVAAFRATLTNFDPRYCDAVMIYSYPPGLTYSVPGAAYDWSMSSILSPALALLRKAGWSPSTEPLIAVPPSFRYNPRLIPGTAGSIEYRAVSTQQQFASEVDAFCAEGATSIIGYAWNDSNVGPDGAAVPELWNSSQLRSALKTSVQRCSSQYWG